MRELYLDTHALVWLYERRADKFPEPALVAMETAENLWLPAMALLELEYLHRKGTLSVPAETIYGALSAELNVRLNPDAVFPRVAWAALALDWTRDPFDRLIVAESQCCGDGLLSKDATIRANCKSAAWD